MFRIFQFIKSDDEHVQINIPKDLQGKLVEIIVSEKAPDSDTVLNDNEKKSMTQKEEELIMMDKVRNQLNVWDM